MIFVSIKTYQERMFGKDCPLYQQLCLAGWQSMPYNHFLSWDRSVFVSEAPDHAGLCLGCWHRDARLSLSAPRSQAQFRARVTELLT